MSNVKDYPPYLDYPIDRKESWRIHTRILGPMTPVAYVKVESPIHKSEVRIHLMKHYYDGGVKYRCPICEAAGVPASICQGEETCPICGVKLCWDDEL